MRDNIVGMFTGRVCLSLMERIGATMVCLKSRKVAMMEKGKHKFRRRSEQYENQISGGIA
jgi:hypothetical protein